MAEPVDDELEPGPPIEEVMAHELAEEVSELLWLAAEIDGRSQQPVDLYIAGPIPA